MAVTVQVRERVGFHRDVYNSLVKCLIRQRKSGEFCDVILRVAGRSYHAHRAVLAAASPFFRSMFLARMKEQDSQEIDLTQSINLDGEDSFKRVIDFMYCGDIEINVDNVEDVLRIADFLLFDDIKDYCRQFFLSHGNLNLSNCLWVSVLAEHHNLTDVADVANAMVRCRFHDYFVHGEEIEDLPMQILGRLLGDLEATRFVTLDCLLRVVLRWARHDPVSRQQQLRRLLEVLAGGEKDVGMAEVLAEMVPECDVMERLSVIVDMISDIASNDTCSNPMQEVEDNGMFIDDDIDEMDEDDVDLTSEIVGALLEASEPSDPVIVALNCNIVLKFFRIYVYDISRRLWRALPLCTEAALSVVPPRLTVCAAALHASVLFLLLTHDLPYPSDLQRIHILAFDVGRGRLALLTFHQRRSRRTMVNGPVAVHLQTTMTDVRAVPPILVHCAGNLCVVGNADAIGNVFVCDLATSTYTCYAIPGTRFISLARVAVRDDRFLYIWCRHRFGLEAYCVNREVTFAIFDAKRRCFVAPLPPPPGIGYDDFAAAGHVLCTDKQGRAVIHSPGHRSYVFDELKNLWSVSSESTPSIEELRVPPDLPYRGSELYTYLDDGESGGVYAFTNPAPFVTSLAFLGAGRPEPTPLPPPPIDGIAVVAAGWLRTAFCTALPAAEHFDESFAQLVHKKTRQLYDTDTADDGLIDGRRSAASNSSDSSSDIEDGLEYDDDIYGYFDDYEYDRSINML